MLWDVVTNMLRLDHHVTQFASQIIDGLDQFFLCRNRWGGKEEVPPGPCGYFAPATNWSPNLAERLKCSWKCPRCGQTYSPGKEKPGLIGANMLLVVEGDGKDMGLKQVKGKLAEGEVRFYPLWWPDTATTSLLDKFKEVMLGVSHKVNDMSQEQLRLEIVELDKRLAEQRSFFRPLELNKTALDEIEWMNANGKRETSDHSRRWIIDHLRGGFIGGRYMWKETDVALDMETVAQMFCFCHAIKDDE